MGAERYEIKELPSNISSVSAAAIDAASLAASGEVVNYDFALATLNVIGFGANALVGGPKSATPEEVKELTDEEAQGVLETLGAAGENPEAKNAIPVMLLISLGIWLLKRLVK
jgi:hypothetical protein